MAEVKARLLDDGVHVDWVGRHGDDAYRDFLSVAEELRDGAANKGLQFISLGNDGFELKAVNFQSLPGWRFRNSISPFGEEMSVSELRGHFSDLLCSNIFSFGSRKF